jgi:competence protein ComEA
MNKFIRDFFGFNATEIKGFQVMILLLILLFSSHFWLKSLSSSSPLEVFSQTKSDSLTALLEVRQKAEKEAFEQQFDNNNFAFKEEDFRKNTTAETFAFDPNMVDQNDLQRLGLKPWIAERIIKYRAAGGKFKKKEDLLKIYGFPEEIYTRIEPYVQIGAVENVALAKVENKPAVETKPMFVPKKTDLVAAFDLNKADTTELMQIKGVGSKTSARIIKYRETLGGFSTEIQIKEVFGLDSAVVATLLKAGFVKNPTLRKIPINTVTELKHIYLKPYVAKAILAYRQQHGKFASADDLKPIKLLDEQTLERLKPYLEF